MGMGRIDYPIPASAVEAAARALFMRYDDARDDWQSAYRANAEKALRAAFDELGMECEVVYEELGTALEPKRRLVSRLDAGGEAVSDKPRTWTLRGVGAEMDWRGSIVVDGPLLDRHEKRGVIELEPVLDLLEDAFMLDVDRIEAFLREHGRLK